jgi:hypothetical protein
VRPNVSCVVIVLCVFALVPSMWAQVEVSPSHMGVPQDWSTHHILFSRDTVAQHPEMMNDPRVRYQAMQRWHSQSSQVSPDTAQATSAINNSSNSDWNVSLVKGHVSANMYPAKYSFDPSLAPSCLNDYVVFGIAASGVTGGQANLIGFNNLYSGTAPSLCTRTTPTVKFAYNVTTVAGGKILTSPVISYDGTKIAFVESTTTASIFHVLTINNLGSITVSASGASTMTSVTFSSATSTLSSPWVDYAADVAYVGADDGKIYKITSVFHGTPTVASSGGFPVTVTLNDRLTSPVLDSIQGLLMVGSGNGSLYQINASSGAYSLLAVGKGTYSQIKAPPMVDITNGTTFVVSANDGTSAVLVEADTSTLGQLAKVRLGSGGHGATSALYLYEPAFDNNYYNYVPPNPNNGYVHVCGTNPTVPTDYSPYQYSIGFTGAIMNTTPAFSQQLLPSTAARCTDWTEFYNPNIGGGTDFFFFGLTQDCTGATTLGCVVTMTNNTSLTFTPINGGPSGIQVDNYSTAPQASSIYFTAEKANTAYKLPQ